MGEVTFGTVISITFVDGTPIVLALAPNLDRRLHEDTWNGVVVGGDDPGWTPGMIVTFPGKLDRPMMSIVEEGT